MSSEHTLSFQLHRLINDLGLRARTVSLKINKIRIHFFKTRSNV